jgi:hypothetical protein
MTENYEALWSGAREANKKPEKEAEELQTRLADAQE